MIRHASWAVPALGLLLLLAACSGRTLVESDLGHEGAPEWVNAGTQMLNDRGGRLFHGVGQAPAMGDESLQVSTADGRARAELARILSSWLDVMSSDYAASSQSGAGAAAQQTVTRQIQDVTRLNLSGARIIAHWKDPKTRAVFSLAELDLDQMKSALGAVKDMNQDLRQYIDVHGEGLFDRLAREKP